MNKGHFAAALLLIRTLAFADSDESLKAALEGRYQEMKAAMAARDSVRVRALLAPGFLSEDTTGKRQDAGEMLRDLAALPKDPEKSSDTLVLSVQRNGDTAVVSQRYHMVTNKRGEDGSTRQVDLVTISRDTWTLTADGTWLLTSTVTQQLDYTVNGKLVVHKEHSSQ